MLTSIRWLNRYLDPSTLTPDEAEAKLIAHSFPIESREAKQTPEGPDTVLDVEVTSNRGDCLCHLGLARDLAVTTGRKLLSPRPAVVGKGPKVETVTSVENQVPVLCARFTARVIRGVKVGPSPKWLVSALESIGQRSINNVVDVSNFVLFELGHPSHTFDLNTLRGKRLVVRHAKAGEELVALDKRTHKLLPGDVVVADAERAVSLAGVIGGLDTGVTEKTTDVLLEVATWDPATIRRAARRLEIRTDAGYRFERIVDARDLEWASARCAELIMELAGGELCDGVISVGAPLAAPAVIELRPARCEHVLGKAIAASEMVALLRGIGVTCAEVSGGGGGGGTIRCTPPHHRLDLTREIDLIEEVARLHGLDSIKESQTIGVSLDSRQPIAWPLREKATRELGRVLTSQGFHETVTFSFMVPAHAAMFMPAGLRGLRVDEARRKDMPAMRPSVIPSLLTCRRANQDAKAAPSGGVGGSAGIRLFELAAVFAEADGAAARQTVERRVLAMLADAGDSHDSRQAALRAVRGTIERAVRELGGAGATVAFEPTAPPNAGIDAAGCASVRLGGASEKTAGFIGLVNGAALSAWGLDQSAAVAEVDLGALIALYPPRNSAKLLPQFPAIERDLSVILDEKIAWETVERTLAGLSLERLESRAFVGTYRGKQIGAGKKSVTLRLRFRDDSRTLRHEEVDPQVGQAVAALKQSLGAELRA